MPAKVRSWLALLDTREPKIQQVGVVSKRVFDNVQGRKARLVAMGILGQRLVLRCS